MRRRFWRTMSVIRYSAYYGEDVEDVLEKVGVTLGVNDVVEPDENEKVTEDTEIVVTRRYEVSITADGETRELLAPSNTVEQTLSDQGLPLGADDLVSVNLQERVCDGMQIVVSRVTYQDVTVTEEIPYETTTKRMRRSTAARRLWKSRVR